MWVETDRCSVEGCPSLAAYEVVRYDFNLASGYRGAVSRARRQASGLMLSRRRRRGRGDRGRPLIDRANG